MSNHMVGICPICGGIQDNRAKRCKNCCLKSGDCRRGTGNKFYEHNGYKYARQSNGKYKKLARLEMERHIGRTLTSTEIVHHIDGNKNNNNIENLMLFPNHSEHARLHSLLRKGRVYVTN